jgi:hypothetical protein
LQRGAVCTVSQLDGGLGELGQTSNGEVLLVGLRRLDDVFSLLHSVEHVGLAVLIAVGANTQINFAGILVGLEGLGNTCVTRRLENFPSISVLLTTATAQCA